MDLIEGEDFYFEGELMVMTPNYHLKRGYCCGSGCRHCPYFPKHEAGSTIVRDCVIDPQTKSELPAPEPSQKY